MDLIRETVSVDRFRFKDGKYNLDLTYITPRIIAMAFPAEGVEQLWRNHLDEVIAMLTDYHRDHFLILNLSERTWEYAKVNYQIFEFGFPDHHPPALFLMFKILLAMDKWLKADPANVVVVHCKGGKGRTGTVIASYLLYNRECATPEQALHFFAIRRSADAKGVEQASQRRYVHYCHRVLSANTPPRVAPIKLSRVIVNSVPKLKGQPCKLFIQIKNVPSYEVFYYTHNVAYERVPEVSDDTVKFDMTNANVLLEGDILMEFHHQIDYKRSKLLWSFYFHTAFIDEHTLFLGKDDVDSLKKENEKLYADISSDFMINLIFEDISGFFKVDQLRTKSDTESAELCRALLFARNAPPSQPDPPIVVQTSASSSPRIIVPSLSAAAVTAASSQILNRAATQPGGGGLHRSSVSEIALRQNRRPISPPRSPDSSSPSSSSPIANSALTKDAPTLTGTLRRPTTPLPGVPPPRVGRSETVSSYLRDHTPPSSPHRKPTSPLPDRPSPTGRASLSGSANSEVDSARGSRGGTILRPPAAPLPPVPKPAPFMIPSLTSDGAGLRSSAHRPLSPPSTTSSSSSVEVPTRSPSSTHREKKEKEKEKKKKKKKTKEPNDTFEKIV